MAKLCVFAAIFWRSNDPRLPFEGSGRVMDGLEATFSSSGTGVGGSKDGLEYLTDLLLLMIGTGPE